MRRCGNKEAGMTEGKVGVGNVDGLLKTCKAKDIFYFSKAQKEPFPTNIFL